MTTRLLVVLLPLWAITLLGARPATTTSAPARPDEGVSASFAIEGARLTYSGPVAVAVGQPVQASISLENDGRRPIFLHCDWNGLVHTEVIVTSGEGKATGSVTPGALAPTRDGEHIASVEAGQAIRETLELSQGLAFVRPGLYRITFRQSINAVVRVPGVPERVLEIKDVPLEVVAPATTRP